MNRTRSYCHVCRKSKPRMVLIELPDGRDVCATCLGITDAEIPEVELHRMRESLSYSRNREGKELPMDSDVQACDFCCLAERDRDLLHLPWLLDGMVRDVHLCRSCAEEHCVVLRDGERLIFQRIAVALSRLKEIRGGD